MEDAQDSLPLARSRELLIQEVGDETLVYDLERHRAHCLNRTAALIWRHCDGRTSEEALAAVLERESDLPRDPRLVSLALRDLTKARLLDGPRHSSARRPAAQGEEARVSRRDLARQMRLVVAALPAVVSILAPTAASAASCAAPNELCGNSSTPKGLPCCTGKKCVNTGGGINMCPTT